jgi:hypothetical protein
MTNVSLILSNYTFNGILNKKISFSRFSTNLMSVIVILVASGNQQHPIDSLIGNQRATYRQG